MVVFPTEILLLLIAIAAAAVLSVLSTLASLVRNSTAVHDLAVAASTLRIDYAKQLARYEEEGIIDDDDAPVEVSAVLPVETV